MTKIEELLGVLDLPDEKQQGAVIRLMCHPYTPNRQIRELSLADLAIRLRDEAVNTPRPAGIDYWQKGMVEVAKHCTYVSTTDWREQMYYFFTHKAKVKHWIIAALIARELAKKGD